MWHLLAFKVFTWYGFSLCCDYRIRLAVCFSRTDLLKNLVETIELGTYRKVYEISVLIYLNTMEDARSFSHYPSFSIRIGFFYSFLAGMVAMSWLYLYAKF